MRCQIVPPDVRRSPRPGVGVNRSVADCRQEHFGMAPTDSVDVRDSRTPSTRAISSTQSGSGSRWWIWLLVLVLVGAGYWYYRGRSSQASSNAGAPGGKGTAVGPGGAPGSFVVPVVVATASKGDLPVFLNGLGNVTAFNTVTVRSRVDGQIVKVNFIEGQYVKEGDSLIEIDPRPYQVQLEQAQGQLAKDQAQLRDVQV